MGLLRGVVNGVKERIGFDAMTKPLEHDVPPETVRGASSWAYVFGFGIIFSFLLQVLTGIVLATKYVPSPDSAYQSVQFITDEVRFGRMVRSMHWIGASTMIVLVLIHALRVFLTASYKYPRTFNWISGAILLYLTFGMAFSGQLLRWDQNGIWTVIVAANFAGRVPLIGEWLGQFILAGETLSGDTLTRFFVLHVFVLPIIIALLIGFHLFLVSYHGISEMPRTGEPVDPKTYRQRYDAYVKRHRLQYWPHGIWNEILFGGMVILAIVTLAFLVGPRELAPPPDLTDLAAQPRPDWFLIWYYALISVKPHGYENFFLVYLPILFLVFLTLLPIFDDRGERSPKRRPFAIFGVSVIVGTLFLLTIVGLRAPWVPAYDTEPLTAEQLGVADGPVFEGAQLFYERGCQYCHLALGEGGEWGPDLTRTPRYMSAGEMRVRIVQGRGNMPPYQDTLTQEELDAIIAFIVALPDIDRFGAPRE
jgi:ubiquinol-cytochrome c reductase cytochrome b subunit